MVQVLQVLFAMVVINLLRVLSVGELLTVGELDLDADFVAHTCDDDWECD